MIPIPFVGEAYTLPSLNAAAQRCLNMYMEPVKGETKSQLILKRRSGLTLFATVPGVNRKIFGTSKGRLFSVNGANLTEIDTNGNIFSRGTLTTNTGDVGIADNGNQLAVVDGIGGYVLDLNSNAFGNITDVNFPKAATHITFQDGYLIVNNPASTPSGEFNLSGIRDAFSWGGLEFGNAEGSADIVNALISTGRELWLFGPSSTEVWVNTGAANFPFQRVSGSYSEIGCFAPYSVAKMDNRVFWLGADDQGYGQIFTNQGYRPFRISTYAIEQEIVTYPFIEDAEAFCYQEGGHNFYVISFKRASKTWCFDLNTGSWHERAFTDFNNNRESRYRGSSHAFFNGKNYVSDPTNGNIYEVDPKSLNDNGTKIKKLRSSPHIWNNLERLFFNSFQIDLETGLGATTGQFKDPQGMLRWSNDGAHTWSSVERWKPLGKKGEYRTRVKYDRLGAARDRVWEFSVTDDVDLTILNAHIKANNGGVT